MGSNLKVQRGLFRALSDSLSYDEGEETFQVVTASLLCLIGGLVNEANARHILHCRGCVEEGYTLQLPVRTTFIEYKQYT